MMTTSSTPLLVNTGPERATLVRRTYTLVFFNVIVTMAGAAYGFATPAIRATIAAHPFLSILAALAPLLAAQYLRNRFPLNLTMVVAFTFAMGLILSPSLHLYHTQNPTLIPQAAVLTLSTFAILTIYAFLSRRDFSAWGSFFTIGLWVLIGTSIVNLFFQNPSADLWLAAGTIIIFSGLLIFDTWRLRNVYGPDDYVLAAVQIYLDLLNIFLAILRILGGNRRD